MPPLKPYKWSPGSFLFIVGVAEDEHLLGGMLIFNRYGCGFIEILQENVDPFKGLFDLFKIFALFFRQLPVADGGDENNGSAFLAGRLHLVRNEG